MTTTKKLSQDLMIETALIIWKRLKNDPNADQEYLADVEAYLATALGMRDNFKSDAAN